jgi:HAD superfamily hydrolase (TIGR01549 family)
MPSQTLARSSRLKGVLFDLDGVLIDSARAWHRVISSSAERLSGLEVPFDRFSETFGQGPDADRAAYFPDSTASEVSRLYHECFPEHLDAVELIDGALEVLEQLRERGLRCAVVTNTPRELAQKILRSKGIDELIDTVAGAGDAPEKPVPDLIHVALSRLDLGTDEVLYVGDSNSDRGAARAAGVFMVGLNQQGDATIHALPELLGCLDT